MLAFVLEVVPVEELTPEQLRVVIVVYTSSLVPLLVIAFLRLRGSLPTWVLPVYITSFLACALGWEIWFTFGLVDGAPVDLRRAPALSAAIPQNINWLMNSLADAGSICLLGIWLLSMIFGRNSAVFRNWSWAAFSVLLFWFLAQNILVEMFLYHDQLAAGKPLSWAPLAPTGPWWNPVLFEFRDRTITLQGQLPWLIMTPIFYWGLTRYFTSRRPGMAG
jgi:hypothetical protein